MISLDTKRYISGLKITLFGTVGIHIIAMIIWLILFHDLSYYPFSLLNLGIGGLALLVGGIIGPGRFKQEFTLVLYMPRDGGTFSKYFKVAGYAVDESIQSVDFYVNGTKYDTIELSEDHTFEKVYKEKDILDGDVNYVWLESGDVKSNRSLMTFYDPDDFDEDELEEIELKEYNFEKKRTIQEARDLYFKDRNKGTGSLSLGFFTGGTFLIISGWITSVIASLFT